MFGVCRGHIRTTGYLAMSVCVSLLSACSPLATQARLMNQVQRGRNAVVAAGGAAATLRTAQQFQSWHIRASVLELLFSLVVEAEGKAAVQALDIDPPKVKKTRRARRSSSTRKTGRTGAVSAVFALEKDALACWRSEQPGRSNAQPEPGLFRPRLLWTLLHIP